MHPLFGAKRPICIIVLRKASETKVFYFLKYTLNALLKLIQPIKHGVCPNPPRSRCVDIDNAIQWSPDISNSDISKSRLLISSADD